MIIDGAGENTAKDADPWSIMVWKVDPALQRFGYHKIYLKDAFIDSLPGRKDADTIIWNMYKRNRVDCLGVEVWGNTVLLDDHIKKMFFENGVYLHEDVGNFKKLTPKNRQKKGSSDARIEQHWQGLLAYGHFYISDYIKPKYREHLIFEIDKFPHWKDDGLDNGAYIPDMIEDVQLGYHIDIDDEDETWDYEEYPEITPGASYINH